MKVFTDYNLVEPQDEEEEDDCIIQQFTHEDIIRDFRKLVSDGFYQA
jgi:hypothetical protein